ncbi:MAG: LysM peptidoglycan-binding domain-containing protein [Gemmatimonadales bacterium]|nr:LysM peptidoglycan-binding domain-containing protein [Gemmatimonadales bacterium]NIN09858.1 LysM peptidoglycan-binding domain-containing protein [Gemmatimonadales bacterium]NIN48562.1 LysM peptidoglycan-binding domain-containing protein [Gemmatimonadales bacterium]NIP06026.1 LysM peptidoglycan-binding domain-containing protein [Gemmatimonadales bacterium]NIR01172.1 LysM peptidoglycan-binding domain-containing protein [Gemmatimonadales bacterium]
MRKTTIFRSSRIAVLCVLLVGMASSVRAQDTLQVGQRPNVHVVVVGETLWELAERYLGDPFMWPEIYRLNTLVVEDPHWIFPGEELWLVTPDTAGGVVVTVPGQPGVPQAQQAPVQQQAVVGLPPEQAVEPPPEDSLEVLPPPGAPPPPPPTETAPTVFARRTALRGGMRAVGSGLFRYRPIRQGEFYAAGFLTEGQELPWGEVLGAVGKPTLRNLTASSSAMIFGEIQVRPPRGAAYQVGDSLLLASLRREVPNWGNVVVPSGIARVTNASEDEVVAQVVAQFDRIADGQVAMPLEPFVDPGTAVPVPVENGISGSVVEPRDLNPVAGQQDIIFIDLGRSDGVALGDVFVVLRPRDQAGMAPDTVAFMQIVHRRERSASGLLTVINQLGVVPEAPVRLARKMPS